MRLPYWLVLWCAAILPRAFATEQTIDLAGAWAFTIDPLDRGETLGWTKPAGDWTGERPHPLQGWDEAKVPHDFLSDPRYEFTGIGWYRRSFALPAGSRGAPAQVWRLQFDSVFQRCRIWLNGELIGTHDGGYTPFEFDVSARVRTDRQNFLVVAVDNRVQLRSLPGARTGASPNSQTYPWLNYGGILGGARVVGHAPVYVAQQTIVATPDLSRGTATVVARVRVRNENAEAKTVRVRAVFAEDGASAELAKIEREVSLAGRTEQIVDLKQELPREAVKLWSLEAQPLYHARASISADGVEHAREDRFGIRRIEIAEAQFHVNGRAVRIAGANRARGHPRFGGRDPDEAVAEDMALMKAAGLRFSRLQHTAPGRNLLEWADRNGMLLILEVGSWGAPAADLGAPEYQAQFRAEMRELIALAENHPSVVGWSLGNEYETWTPEGIAWTREMAKFVKAIDPTRPVTTPAIGPAVRRLRTDPVGEHAFDYVDFISVNLYVPPAELAQYLDSVNVRWPKKPVFISEYGQRADRVKQEQDRLTHFDAYLDTVRARPWVCGLSYWTFNDYRSHFPGTGEDGFRRWGMVDEHRKPRALYEHVRERLRERNL